MLYGNGKLDWNLKIVHFARSVMLVPPGDIHYPTLDGNVAIQS